MSLPKKIGICILAATLMFCSSHVNYAAQENYTLATDEKGSFYTLRATENQYTVFRTDASDSSRFAFENLTADSLYYTGGALYVCGDNEGLTVAVRYKNVKRETVLLDGIKIKPNCFAANENAEIYLVNTESPTTVSIFNYYGQLLRAVNIGTNIQMLFSVDNQMYAVTSDGVTHVDNQRHIHCVVPSSIENWSGTYCTDGGTVYRFDTVNGFEKVCQTHYSQTAVVNHTVYGLRERTIYRLNKNGDAVQKYDLPKIPNRLLCSGNSLAVLYGETVNTVKISDFEKIKAEHSESSQKSETSQRESSRSESSKSVRSESHPSEVSDKPKSYAVSSEIYTIDDGWIYDIPQGTTIAQLKKNIAYGDNRISFQNHHQESVKSGTVGTGFTVTFSGNGKTSVFQTIIDGDVTGEGNVNSRDRTLLMKYLVHYAELSDIQKIAADCNHDGAIDSKDLWLMRS